MHQTLGRFRAVLLAGWIALSAAGILYAREKNIPLEAALPLMAAFLLEYSFYLAPGFEAVRDRLRVRLRRPQLALAMAVAAVAPYLVYAIPTGQFRSTSAAALAVLAAVIAFWYVVLRPSPVADILFLALAAAIALSRVFARLYTSPVAVHVEILGNLMLIRTSALAVLEFRRVENVCYGFLPNQKEWITGVRYFFYLLPVAFPLALGLGLAHLNFIGFIFWKMLATFAGALWVTALAEEFYFRGLLQQWLAAWTTKPYLALAVASLLFGAAHLSFRAFPNWRMATEAAVCGVFYGMAWQKTSSIRASMVTHALVVTLWRTLFA